MIDEKLVNDFIDNYLEEYIDNIAAKTLEIIDYYYSPEFFQLNGVKPREEFGLALVEDGSFLCTEHPSTFYVQDSLKKIHAFMVNEKYKDEYIYEIIKVACEKYNKRDLLEPLIPALYFGYKEVFGKYLDLVVTKPSIDFEITSVQKPKGGFISWLASTPTKINAKIKLPKVIVDYLAALSKYTDEKFYSTEYIQMTRNSDDNYGGLREYEKKSFGDEFEFVLYNVSLKEADSVIEEYKNSIKKREKYINSIKLIVGINTSLDL